MKLRWKLPLLLDGATGTQLLTAGMEVDACPEQWSMEHPDVLTELQRRYVLAGCDVLYTPTFGANRVRLAAFGLEHRVQKMNHQLTKLTRAAIDSCPRCHCLIAGCMSPTGLKTEPTGDISLSLVEDIYTEQAFALKNAGVDLLVIETMTNLNEARAALLAARETELPVIVTLTINENGKTLSGARLLPSVITLQSLGAVAVGLNCSTGPSDMAEPLFQALPHAAVPLIAKPSTMSATGNLSPAKFAQRMGSLLDAGATIVGGCCGTSPEYIAILRGILDKHPIVAPREIDTDACAVESEAFFLTDNPDFSEPIPCNSELTDKLIEAEENYTVALVELRYKEDIKALQEYGSMSRLPIALHTDSTILLDEALHRFPGRLIVDSLCEIERPLLGDIASRYGALVF